MRWQVVRNYYVTYTCVYHTRHIKQTMSFCLMVSLIIGLSADIKKRDGVAGGSSVDRNPWACYVLESLLFSQSQKDEQVVFFKILHILQLTITRISWNIVALRTPRIWIFGPHHMMETIGSGQNDWNCVISGPDSGHTVLSQDSGHTVLSQDPTQDTLCYLRTRLRTHCVISGPDSGHTVLSQDPTQDTLCYLRTRLRTHCVISGPDSGHTVCKFGSLIKWE